MTADQLKTIIMGNYMHGKGYVGLFTEVFYGNADVLGIRKSLYSVEFEVKVTMGDLRKEIHAIQYVLGNKDVSVHSNTKYYKHHYYLKGNRLKNSDNTYIKAQPNLFYFVVPEKLRMDAIRGVENTPYGVLTCNETHTVLKELVKPQYMHKDRISQDQLLKIMGRAARELHETRKKLYKVE